MYAYPSRGVFAFTDADLFQMKTSLFDGKASRIGMTCGGKTR